MYDPFIWIHGIEIVAGIEIVGIILWANQPHTIYDPLLPLQGKRPGFLEIPRRMHIHGQNYYLILGPSSRHMKDCLAQTTSQPHDNA